jgi:transposase
MWKFRPKRQDISNLLRHAEQLHLTKRAKQRLTWFAFATAHGGNVSLTCRYFGISRSTFLRWAKRFDARNPETLEEYSRKPHTVRQTNVSQAIIDLIKNYRMSSPTMGKEQIAKHLHTEHNIVLSSSTVGRIIARHGFFFGSLPSHQNKRIGVDLAIERNTPTHTVHNEIPTVTDTAESPHPTLPASDFPIFGS